MSNPAPAPSPGDDTQPQNSNAPDPRHAPAEEFAAIDVRQCQAENCQGEQCGNPTVPGQFFCAVHFNTGELPKCDGCGRRRLRDGLDETDDGLRCPECLGGGE